MLLTVELKRLIHLSILKSENENGNEILLKLNQWIKQVKYNTFDNNDMLTKHLHDENCSLKQIVYAYNILKQQFQNLSNQHLQLIKTALQCSFVTEIMKKSDLYSFHEYQRFQELRDNLTA
ncbi:unnamed protein product [Adineta steineri]|uniref:Uncharacterized protein n=1 Tax=Adineta steineri TaxID=433720 RepID=A0A819P7H2_9BILA|nr:unnamed protein product [Adineta steineri]CAF4006040.1 unnamed protein product [Adineta steineri]